MNGELDFLVDGGGGDIGLMRCGACRRIRDRLAQSCFKDAGVLLEHSIDDARHVDVQIFDVERAELM